MAELLHHLFGCVCGQNPVHTWAPGGVWLPVCQRCTGLYAGACVAALLHLALRPVATSRWLWLHGGFLLCMIPFGYHWLPQGPVLRALTGVLFGFGLVAFLRLPLRLAPGHTFAENAHSAPGSPLNNCYGRRGRRPSRSETVFSSILGRVSVLADRILPRGKVFYQWAAGPVWRYAAGLFATLALVPWLGARGNALAAGTLEWLAAGGALVLFSLMLANVCLAARWLARRILTDTSRASA